jgi:hypothetical protein
MYGLWTQQETASGKSPYLVVPGVLGCCTARDEGAHQRKSPQDFPTGSQGGAVCDNTIKGRCTIKGQVIYCIVGPHREWLRGGLQRAKDAGASLWGQEGTWWDGYRLEIRRQGVRRAVFESFEGGEPGGF